MTTRDNLRNAASTLAHMWVHRDEWATGVERLLVAYLAETHAALCAHVVRQLHCQAASPEDVHSFLELLCDIAGIEDDSHD